MYAVIATGGKQQRVETGQVLEVELLGVDEDSEVTFKPVLLVDGDSVLATPDELSGCTVTAQVTERTKGPKIRGFIYKNATTYRKRWGHRQHYDKIRITDIKATKD